jgi:two-component system chemotaxis sensor kinase CheA
MSIDFENLRIEFVTESMELLERAESDTLNLEKGFDPALINNIFRAVHTVKGNSGLFDLKNISDLAHAFENVLNTIRSGELETGMDVIDLILIGIDRLRDLISHLPESGSRDNADLIERLNATMRAKGSERETPRMETDIGKKPVVGAPSGEVIETEWGRAQTGTTGEAFRIPGKFIRLAQEKERYLCLIYQNLGDFSDSVYDAALRISKIPKDVMVMHGIREGRIDPDSQEIPYYFLIMTEKNVKETLREYGIEGSIRMLYNPHEELFAETVAEGEERFPEESPAMIKNAEIINAEVMKERFDVADLPQKGELLTAVEGAQDAGAAKGEAAESHLKVPLKLIDSLINLAGETVIARNELSQRILSFRDVGLEMAGKRMSQLITRLQEEIMRTRLQEVNTVFQRLPRLIRDLSHSTGKKIKLVMEGGDVELDKSLIEAIGDSIMHMVRNSIDHGIEEPDERRRFGKSPDGNVKISAHLRGGNVVITIQDDGRGIDIERVRDKALARGMISQDQARTMTREQLTDLIFAAGLSTAERVTSTSGRGVGMDVVRSNFLRLGGGVEVFTEKGAGTTILATVPQTLTIVTSLLIKSHRNLFALPQQNVVEMLRIDPTMMQVVENHNVYELRGHLLPIINLGEMLKISSDEERQAPTHIAIVRSERHHFGILVDAIINLEEIVVKRLGAHFAGLNVFSGAAIMGDGEAVLILDVPGLAKHANLQANISELEEERVARGEIEEEGYLLFSASKQKFAVPVATIPRIEKISLSGIEWFMGMEVVKYRDEVVPVVRLNDLYELVGDGNTGDIYLIIFTVNGIRSGIVADEILNVVRELPRLDRSKFLGQAVIGHTIINGETTLAIDAVLMMGEFQKTRFKDISKKIKKMVMKPESEKERSGPGTMLSAESGVAPEAAETAAIRSGASSDNESNGDDVIGATREEVGHG